MYKQITKEEALSETVVKYCHPFEGEIPEQVIARVVALHPDQRVEFYLRGQTTPTRVITRGKDLIKQK